MAWDFTADSEKQSELSVTLKNASENFVKQKDAIYTKIGELSTYWVGEDYNAFVEGTNGYKTALQDFGNSIMVFSDYFKDLSENTVELSDALIKAIGEFCDACADLANVSFELPFDAAIGGSTVNGEGDNSGLGNDGISSNDGTEETIWEWIQEQNLDDQDIESLLEEEGLSDEEIKSLLNKLSVTGITIEDIKENYSDEKYIELLARLLGVPTQSIQALINVAININIEAPVGTPNIGADEDPNASGTGEDPNASGTGEDPNASGAGEDPNASVTNGDPNASGANVSDGVYSIRRGDSCKIDYNGSLIDVVYHGSDSSGNNIYIYTDSLGVNCILKQYADGSIIKIQDSPDLAWHYYDGDMYGGMTTNPSNAEAKHLPSMDTVTPNSNYSDFGNAKEHVEFGAVDGSNVLGTNEFATMNPGRIKSNPNCIKLLNDHTPILEFHTEIETEWWRPNLNKNSNTLYMVWDEEAQKYYSLEPDGNGGYYYDRDMYGYTIDEMLNWNILNN